MKIEGMTVQGFRGFNEQRSIDFHPNLTLIYDPNSYGKTSITEAVEWLLYGKTSKVDKAETRAKVFPQKVIDFGRFLKMAMSDVAC